jgi:DNA-binding CsgD family transcriptional regulator
LWWARAVLTQRHRRRIYAIGALALVIGAENLVQALAPMHPRSAAHFIANLVLAVAGVVAVFIVSAYGHEIVVEERLLYALSRGQLGARNGSRRASVALTPRETEVMRCLCEGLGTERIAERLGISPHTASTHIRNIMKKLDVGSRADAIVWAVRYGLLDGKG